MMLSRVERLAAGTAGFVAATWTCGWWGVPVGALLWRLVDRRARWWEAGATAFLAWATLLGWVGTAAAKRELIHRLAGVFGLPAAVLGVGTPLFAAALALAAWWLVHEVQRLAPGDRNR